MSFSLGASWALALVRTDGVPSITLLSLLDGTQSVVNLPGDPTDLAVSPNGDFAVVVLRDSATVEMLPLPGIFQGPTLMQSVTIPGETIGQAVITAQGSRVLLFTTAAPVSRMTVLTLAPTPSHRTVELYAPIMAVFAAAESSAVVLHSVTPPDGVEGAFSLVPLDGTGLPNMVSLPAPATAVVSAPTCAPRSTIADECTRRATRVRCPRRAETSTPCRARVTAPARSSRQGPDACTRTGKW